MQQCTSRSPGPTLSDPAELDRVSTIMRQLQEGTNLDCTIGLYPACKTWWGQELLFQQHASVMKIQGKQERTYSGAAMTGSCALGCTTWLESNWISTEMFLLLGSIHVCTEKWLGQSPAFLSESRTACMHKSVTHAKSSR